MVKSMPIMLLLIVLSAFCSFIPTDAQSGACYGILGDNFPSAAEVIELCKANNIHRVRLYNPNRWILDILDSNPDVSAIVGVPNEEIIGIANNPNLAVSWVETNVLRFPGVNFRYIAVGNELLPDGSGYDIASQIHLAMENINSALAAAGLAEKIKVSTAFSMGVLETSYPPSAGVFRTKYLERFMNPIVDFLARTRSPFLINVFPYFAYADKPQLISLDYALFKSPNVVVRDGQYEYRDLFSAMVDAVRAALDRAGGSSVEIVVTETGWPTAGGTATSVENGQTYNSNLLKTVRNGTPRMPGKPLETYIFGLIDENLKTPEVEKHWGIFLPNKQPKYALSF